MFTSHAPGFRAALAALLLVACGSGDDVAEIPRLTAGQPLTQHAPSARAAAHVAAVGGAVIEGKNAFTVTFEPATTELTGASALMPVHGHGTEPIIEKTDGGYRVGNVVFYMSGLWNVHLDLSVDSHVD